MDRREIWCKKKRNVCYVNEDFFKKWTPEMAYILGFFAADGTLTFNRKRKNHYIEFTSIDYEILEKIRKLIKSRHKIGTKKRESKWKKAYRLQIGSKEIFKDLIHLGFTPNKSLTVVFPIVPADYLNHFIRGYFDGDGYCSFCRYKRKDRPSRGRAILTGFVSGSRIFLEKLRDVLRKYAGTNGGTLHFHDGGYRLVYSFKDSQKVYSFLYKNLNNILYLKRKFLNFEQAFKKYGLVV